MATLFAKRLVFTLTCICLVLGGIGCANKTETGMAIGSAIGATGGYLIGKKKGAVLGAAAGAALGGIIGYAWDRYDQRILKQTLEKSPSGARTTWVNPDSNTTYTATPKPAYRKNGKVYRSAEVKSTDAKGNRRIATVEAYRTGNGDWKMAKVQ